MQRLVVQFTIFITCHGVCQRCEGWVGKSLPCKLRLLLKLRVDVDLLLRLWIVKGLGLLRLRPSWLGLGSWWRGREAWLRHYRLGVGSPCCLQAPYTER